MSNTRIGNYISSQVKAATPVCNEAGQVWRCFLFLNFLLDKFTHLANYFSKWLKVWGFWFLCRQISITLFEKSPDFFIGF
jgi:hypothetical protein